MDDNALDMTFFSDEAWIHLSGYINSQNTRIWSAHNPHEFVESPLHPLKIGIWMAMSRRRIVGRIFFQERLNSVSYCEIINQFVAQLTENENRNAWFQQDSATCHVSNHTLAHLRRTFEQRLITKGLWPPRSPNLTPLDSFAFGYIKDTVFSKNPHTLDELRTMVTDVIQNIPREVLINVFQNMRRRVALCIDQHGQQFQHLL